MIFTLLLIALVSWVVLSKTGLTLNGKKVDIWFPLKFGFTKQGGLIIDTVPPPPELKK